MDATEGYPTPCFGIWYSTDMRNQVYNLVYSIKRKDERLLAIKDHREGRISTKLKNLICCRYRILKRKEKGGGIHGHGDKRSVSRDIPLKPSTGGEQANAGNDSTVCDSLPGGSFNVGKVQVCDNRAHQSCGDTEKAHEREHQR